jgi:hypothetical protein
MPGTRFQRLFAILALFAGLGLIVTGSTASNAVPSSHAAVITQSISANSLKPSACSGISIDELVVGSGTVPGTSANDLILGSPNNDMLGQNGAAKGPDCCLAGGGINSYRNSCLVRL